MARPPGSKKCRRCLVREPMLHALRLPISPYPRSFRASDLSKMDIGRGRSRSVSKSIHRQHSEEWVAHTMSFQDTRDMRLAADASTLNLSKPATGFSLVLHSSVGHISRDRPFSAASRPESRRPSATSINESAPGLALCRESPQGWTLNRWWGRLFVSNPTMPQTDE